jgi:membrane protease YdiL (CAAX protease family)
VSDALAPETQRRFALREALAVWAAAFGGLVAAKLLGLAIPFVGANVKAVACFLFLWLPSWRLRLRGLLVDDVGVPPWPWASTEGRRAFLRDLAWGLGVSALLVPLATLGFWGFLRLLDVLPGELRPLLAPYASGGHGIGVALRFPDRFWLHVLDQLLVVALPEELFYRGFLQTRLGDALGRDDGPRVLGVRLGRAFWLTQALFAAGHLAELHVWRLGTFFPSILFGWLRARTGSIGASVIVHAVSNLLILVLEASFFGRR